MRSLRLTASSRRIAATVVAVVGMALWTSGAQGWYALEGTGTGTAPAGALQELTATAEPTAPGLAPGESLDIALGLSNPNPVAVRVEAISIDGSQGDAGFTANRADCTAPALSFATQTNDGAGWLVPAATNGESGRIAIRLTDALAMGEAAQSACQGVTFAVHLRTD